MKEEFNIQTYIDSGILVEYALGLCTTEQNKEILEKLNLYPELQNELRQIEDSLEFFAKQYAKPLPDYLKDQIISRIEQEKTVNYSKKVKGKNILNYLLILTSAALLLTCLYLWNQQNQLRRNFSDMSIEFKELRKLYHSDSIELLDCNQKLKEMLSSNGQRVLLKGTPKSPQSFATVYYDTLSQWAVLNIVDLPPTPPQKQYQLWAIVSGTPLDLGVFDHTTHQSAYKEIKFVPHAQAFAITLEDYGGKASPSMDQMYVLGSL